MVAAGTSKATFTPTGRAAFGLIEYTILTKFPSGGTVPLFPDTYWESLVPNCTNANDSNCGIARYFESDVEGTVTNNRGNEPPNKSFWNSAFFGSNYMPTWGSTGACGGIGCTRFSAGVS